VKTSAVSVGHPNLDNRKRTGQAAETVSIHIRLLTSTASLVPWGAEPKFYSGFGPLEPVVAGPSVDET